MAINLTLDKSFEIGDVDDRLYGSFVEHLGRCVYGGIYDPDHPDSDEQGFRRDVLELVKELRVPLVRYPGGNFVSQYDWKDGIGAKENRPTRLDLAWRSAEPNSVGVNEFINWCKKANTSPLLAVNLGTAGLSEARELLEYVNHPGGTYWSDLRKKHGYKNPHNIKMWCLGNEMDGPWQTGHKTAFEYGRLANETAAMMRSYDRDLELVICGSTHRKMPTFPQWDLDVLDLSYPNVDLLSLHIYVGNETDNFEEYIACSVGMDSHIDSVVSACDLIQAKKRGKKQINLSFDEWNVWYRKRNEKALWDNPWAVGPHLLEEEYNMEDALVVGTLLNSLIRHSDRVKIACLAQLVNVIAPIMAEKTGPAWKQTIFYPYLHASNYGRGTSLQVLYGGDTYDTSEFDSVPFLDTSAVWNKNMSELTVFVVNRRDLAIQTDCTLGGFGDYDVTEHIVLSHQDLKACNAKSSPGTVAPKVASSPLKDREKLTVDLEPRSWNVIRLKKA